MSTNEPRSPSSTAAPSLAGVGLGLRWELLGEVLAASPSDLEPIAFFEVSPENFVRRGGYFPHALEAVAERFELSTHGLSMSIGGVDPLDADYLDEMARFARRFGQAEKAGGWHSDHLCFSSHGGASLHELLPIPFDAASAARVSERVREARSRMGCALAIENVSHYLEPRPGEWSEADFVAEVLERSDAALLLDVNNLDVNAENHGIDPIAYLDRLPLERVVEIHIAGPERWDAVGLVIDTHGAPVRPSALTLLSHVLERTGPLPVLLERDNAVPPLAELVAELRAIRAVYDEAVRRYRARSRPGSTPP